MEELKNFIHDKMTDFGTSTIWDPDTKYVGYNLCEEIINKIDELHEEGKI